jgi:Collagen triple helix repeat (20 copies)
MRSSVGLCLSLVCSLAALACDRAPLAVDGAAGSNGATGAAGTTGPAGATGAAGVAGSAGANGSAGTTGAAGTVGAEGGAGIGGTMTTTSPGGKLFDVCLSASDCFAGLLECYCGICATACMTASWCAGFPASGAASSTCATSIPWTSACTAAPLQSVCAIECMTDGDCSALGPTGVCTAGWCRRPLLVTTTGGHVVTCADRAAEMKAKLDPVVASADRSCMTNADCVQAPLGNGCYGDGCSWVPVSHAGAASVAAELATLQTQECDSAFKAGCVGVGRTNCPLQGNAGCVAGSCQNVGLIPAGP